MSHNKARIFQEYLSSVVATYRNHIQNESSRINTAAARGESEVIRSHRVATCRGGTLNNLIVEQVYNVTITEIALTFQPKIN